MNEMTELPCALWPAGAAEEGVAAGRPASGVHMPIDKWTDARLVIDMAFAERVAQGVEPFTTRLVNSYSGSALRLILPGMQVLRHHHSPNVSVALARGLGCSALVQVSSEGTTVWASAECDQGLRQLVDDMREQYRSLQDLDGDTRLTVWRCGRSGEPIGKVRSITPQSWPEVAGNYPGPVSDRLRALMALERPERQGRLLLWHGEAGTGKTTALLALVRAWMPWCQSHVIADPERVFEDAEYLLRVIQDKQGSLDDHCLGDTGSEEPWKLIVAEDADEYLRSDARRRSGPGLGRLLNVTDGILGIGQRTMVLLTTNDEIGRLHPAVTRPGRCMATVQFTRFSRTEAATWLDGTAPTPGHEPTLAELYHLRSGSSDLGVDTSAPISTGIYL